MKDIKNNKEPKTKKKKVVRESFAACFWIYVLLNTFVLDVDAWLLGIIPYHFRWLIHYKFLVVIVTLGLFLLFRKWKAIFGFFSYTISYPAILTGKAFWKQLKNIFSDQTETVSEKSLKVTVWGVILIPIVRRYFMKFRYRLAGVTLLFSALLITAFNPNPPINILSIILIFANLTIFAWLKIYAVFFSKGILEGSKYADPDFLKKRKSFSEYEKAHAELLSLSTDSQEYTTKRNHNLRKLLSFHKIAEQARLLTEQYSKRGMIVLFSGISFIIMFIFIVFEFGILYESLYQIDTNFFQTHGTPGMLKFMLFSFFQFTGRIVNGLAANSNVVNVFSSIEFWLLIVLLAAVFISVGIPFTRKRYEHDIDAILGFLEARVTEIESKVLELYRISTTEARKELKLEGATIEAYFIDLPNVTAGSNDDTHLLGTDEGIKK